MTTDDAIPGFAELSDWPIPPTLPLRIGDHGSYRDPRPYCTYYLNLIDSQGAKYCFFFDRFLGRLCYGQSDEDDNAAYLKKGSVLQIEAFSIIEKLCRDQPEYAEIQQRLTHARTYV